MRRIKYILFAFVMLCLSQNVWAGIITINNQNDFDLLQSKIEEAIKAGDKNIVVSFGRGPFYYKDDHVLLRDVYGKDVTLSFKGNKTKIISAGRQYHKGDVYDGDFSTKNVWLNHDLKDLFIWGKMYQSDRIVEIIDEKTKLCKIHSPEFNLSPEKVGPNSWLQLTEWYMSGTYKIERVEGNDVYFTAHDLKPGLAAYGNYNVNYDYTVVKCYPRFRVCNMGDAKAALNIVVGQPVSQDFYECQSSTFLQIYGTDFRHIDISGVNFYGNAGKSMLIRLLGARVSEGINIHNCEFHGIKSMAVYMMQTSNSCISNCHFEDCYDHVLLAISKVKNIRITDNYFLNTGKGLRSTFSIHCQCKNFYVANNTLVNFGQGGIAIGTGAKDVDEGNGEVEDNVLYFTDEYAEYARKSSLIDGGAIYLYTKNDGTAVRYNRIHNYTGAHSNRGIYCDDGAYGFTLYGNIVTGNLNSNFIDSRLVPSANLPTNTNNVMEYNIVEGRYKFEGSTKAGNGCRKGKNIVLNVAEGEPYMTVLGKFEKAEDDVHLEYKSNRDLSIVVPRSTQQELKKLPFYSRIKKYIIVR